MAKAKRTEEEMEITTTDTEIIIKYKGLTGRAPLDPGEEVRRKCAWLFFHKGRQPGAFNG